MGRPKKVKASNKSPDTLNSSVTDLVVRRASKRKKILANDTTNDNIKTNARTSMDTPKKMQSSKRSNELQKNKAIKNTDSQSDFTSTERTKYLNEKELENNCAEDSKKVAHKAPKRKNIDVNGYADEEILQHSVKRKKLCSTSKICRNSNAKTDDPSEELKKEIVHINPEVNASETITSTTVNVEGNANSDVSKVTNSSIELCSVNKNAESGNSSSEDEWEEVQDSTEQNLDDYKPDVLEEGVEITIDCPDLKLRRRQKKEFDENEYIRLHINRMRKDAQLSVHKVHLLCLLAQGLSWNNILKSNELKGLALSLIPVSNLIPSSKINKIKVEDIEKMVLWFRECFTLEQIKELSPNVLNMLTKCFETRKASNTSQYNMMFLVIARALSLKVRLCVSLYPTTYKASNLIKKGNSETKSKSVSGPESSSKVKADKSNAKTPAHKAKRKVKSVKSVDKSKIDKNDSQELKIVEMQKRPRRSKEKSYKMSSDEEDGDDEDFELPKEEVKHVPSKTKTLRLSLSEAVEKSVRKSTVNKNRKILSSDSDSSLSGDFKETTNSIKCWSEIYSKPCECWIPVECVNNLVNKPHEIEEVVVQPVSYILAFDNNSYVKDVTRRYCSEFMTVTRKFRVCSDWWEESLEPFMPPNTKADKEEENKLELMLANKPMPTTISGFKNHPLYALKRHLLKFEAIYPPDAPSIGFIRNEPVYARECVCKLHSRETWVKEARVVRVGEEPYKIVKARPKWDRIACELKTDLPLEIFGEWQTEPYQPPEAKNGKVPRNEYGNVELFKPCMLPKGTVHLQIPGLNRVAKKLGIDCSAAVVGFDGHKGSIHPVYDGFVVCKEFKDTLLEAWDEDQENARKREEEKREKRIYGNWRKLIRALLIRERIKLKYNVK